MFLCLGRLDDKDKEMRKVQKCKNQSATELTKRKKKIRRRRSQIHGLSREFGSFS